MQRFPGRRFVVALALAGALAAVQSACSNDPTSENVDRPSLASSAVLTVGGPDSIYVSGTYTYGAHFGALYASFGWWTRSCSTLTVASCTSAWNQAADVITVDQWTTQIRRSLSYSCAPKAVKSFQVKVTASGFGQPPQTAYKVTKLCGSNPNA